MAVVESVPDTAEGKRVVDTDGKEIGIVRTVDEGLPYVEPDPSHAESLLAKLGLGDPGRHSYPIDSRRIETITDDEVRLQVELDAVER